MSKDQSKTKKTASKKSASESMTFGAEIDQLLDIVIHSVYSDREIFLRELISNAADAVEKLRFDALKAPELLPDNYEPSITVSLDKDKNLLTIADNGIGMNDKELVENLGTIARSGTRHFLDNKDEESANTSLIGKFGIGFYAVFMVAKNVTVTSRRAGEDKAWVWASEGRSVYTLNEGEKHDGQGTRIDIELRDDASEFAAPERIRHVIQSYSAHVPVPIDFLSGDENERLAKGQALWREPKASVSEEDHKKFYNETAGMFDEPASTFHIAFEGTQQFYSLLYIPGMRPFDLFDPKRTPAIKLYVKRVFITSESDILPGYLRFMRGVVDSDDLPLSVSREMLQKSGQLSTMSKSLTNRLLSEMGKIAEKDNDKWLTIWQNFGSVLKEGLYEDAERRDKLFALSRFQTTKGDAPRSLTDYIADMKDDQKAIYYITGDASSDLMSSPHIEGFLSRGIEVLLLNDPVDSFWVTTALGFEGKSFKSVTQGGLDLENKQDESDENSEDEKSDKSKHKDDPALAALCTYAETVLGDEVKNVRLSSRLATSPVCLIASDEGLDRNLMRLLAAQQGAQGKTAPIMEINPDHALIKKLASSGENDENKTIIKALFDLSTLMEGELPSDRRRLADAFYALADKNLT